MTSVVEADGTIIIPDPEEDAFAHDGASLRLARGSASYAAGLEPDDGEGLGNPSQPGTTARSTNSPLTCLEHE
jgi:hypothetical protein